MLTPFENKNTQDTNPDYCVDNCFECHRICLEMAMNHCLYKGRNHVEPEHFKLMMTCAEICLACANVQTIRNDFSRDLCRVCADTCLACAESCEEVGEMDECVEICRKCAESCKEMANMSH